LHDIEHQIAIFIYLYDGEIDSSGSEFTHLIPNVKAVWGTAWVFVTDGVVRDINTMAWSIGDQKGLLD